ncbi:MAG: TolC family protein [Planctomycetes bacterium]|nr:TolC family protein [Planctomycetota bacterium]
MAKAVGARVQLLSTVYCAALLSFTAAGCVSSERTRSVGDAMQWDARHAPLPTARPNQLEDDVALPTLDESASLADYLAYAALNNPGLEAAFNLWKAALERVPQEKSLPDPRFTYRYFIREVETRVGPQKQGLGLSQMFPWFGKLELRGSVAAEAAEAARQRYENEKFKLFFEVKDAFYEYYYLGRAIDVVQENLELVDYLESVARARYKTASAGHPDVIRAQVEMGKLEDQVTSLRDLVVPVVARLNAVLNRTSTAKLPLPLSIPEEHMNIAGEEVLKRLARNSPVLRALDHEIERARHAVALAKKNYYPDFTLGVDYTDVGSAVRSKPQGFSNPAALRSASRIAGGMGDLIDAYSIGKSLSPGGRPGDSGQDVWMVSLSMNVPIWRAKYAAGEREARARYLAALSARAQQENSLTATTQRTLFEHRDAGRKIALYRDVLIPKAKESISSTETAFRAGSASFLDLVDAERSLLEFELSFERALANRAQRLAELEMLVGGTLSHGTEGTVEKSQPTKTPVDGRTTEVPEPKRPEEGTDKP